MRKQPSDDLGCHFPRTLVSTHKFVTLASLGGRRYLERELEVFSAPDEQAGIVGAQLQEVGAVNGEQTARVRRRPAAVFSRSKLVRQSVSHVYNK